MARHICQKLSQNEISNDIFEVYQYPILKTQNVSYTGGEDPHLLALNFKVQRQKFLQLRAMVDRPLDFNYCTQDILDVLLK